MEISIIIVSYKTPELVLGCISSIFENAFSLKFEVIVVDNANGDGSKELVLTNFKDVIWIDSGYNAGFSRANNVGIKHAFGEYILLLNPDTYIKENFLAKLLSFYKDQNLILENKLGFLTTRIISSVDQSLLIGTGRKFIGFQKEMNKNPLLILLKRLAQRKKVEYDPYQLHYQNHEVDFVSGACFMIQRSKLIANNLYFDEDFFLYFEDLEFCFRIKKAGLRNYFCSDIEIYHVNSASTSKTNNLNAQIKISEYLFYFKRFNRVQYYLMGKLIQFNFLVNGYLLKRKNELQLMKELQFEKNLFYTYYYQLPYKYSIKRIGEVAFLKYDQKN
jgi:GT2 family glycosyltransferase